MCDYTGKVSEKRDDCLFLHRFLGLGQTGRMVSNPAISQARGGVFEDLDIDRGWVSCPR